MEELTESELQMLILLVKIETIKSADHWQKCVLDQVLTKLEMAKQKENNND